MSLLLIVVRPSGLEFKPQCPRVEAAVEPLRIGIDWSDDPSAWDSVRIGRFLRTDGSQVATRSAGLEFCRSEGNVVKELPFSFLEPADVLCVGQVRGTRRDGKTYGGSFELSLAGTASGPGPSEKPVQQETQKSIQHHSASR